MDNVSIGHLIYLILLGLMVVGWFVASNRQGLNKTLQGMVIWGLLFIGVIAAYGLWNDVRGAISPQQSVFSDRGQVVLPLQADGHFHVTLDVNGEPVRFVVDTGATDIVLTGQDAARVGLTPDRLRFVGRAMTANGEVRTAPVRLDEIAVGDIRDTNVPAFVNEGEMSQSLLGMGYLQRWSSVSISGDELILNR